MTKLPYQCTAYFKGKDHLGTCDSECQWWHETGCPCAKGHEKWDGKDLYSAGFRMKQENESNHLTAQGGEK